MGNRTIYIGSSALAPNDAVAEMNRRGFDEQGVLAINVIGSPGSGKTSLIEAMARVLDRDMAVVVGDVQTRRDAERIRSAGCAARQIETNGACHLNAAQVTEAVKELDLRSLGCKVLVIENVGNLVCPASFHLGEHMKVALLSLPEGDDKVLKYPSIFIRVSALVISKIDLLEQMDFDVDKAIRECASLNDSFEAFRLSAKTGEGVGEFCDFLLANQSALKG